MVLSVMKYVYYIDTEVCVLYIYTHVHHIAMGVFGVMSILHQYSCSGQIQLYITSYTAEWWYKCSDLVPIHTNTMIDVYHRK